MSEQAVRTAIDSLEFARDGQALSGSLPVPALTRLHDMLCDQDGRVDFVVRGGHDLRQRPTLSLEVSGVLHLRCQRCLGRLESPLRVSTTLLLAAPAQAASGELGEEEEDAIEPSTELDVAGLVEDEIILSLPFSPRHPEGACRPGGKASAGQERESAFAKLVALKRN